MLHVITSDTDRLESLLEWLECHVSGLEHHDQVITMEARASGLLTIHGALRERCGDVQWFPIRQLLGVPPDAMVMIQVRAGDLYDMIWALRAELRRMRA